jgi:predicted CoA-substrate-specific enzyme activase
MKSLGICVGASSISLVVLENNKVKEHSTKLHEGDPKQTLEDLLSKINLKEIDYCLITGRKFKEFVKIQNITEPESVEFALENLNLNDYDTIVSAGGENFMVYFLDKNSKISKVESGNKCASGTGEFFLQQIKRMGLKKEEAIELGLSGKPHKISGRCSVFCKSDCTHALNKGEKKEDVVAGLCEMMANKIIELLNKSAHKKVMLIGGTSQNKPMIEFLRKKTSIYIPKEATYFEALGAAYAAQQKKVKQKINFKDLFTKDKSSFTFHKPLKDFIDSVEFKDIQRKKPENNDVCIIGLDVGSTTTKIILLRVKDNAILASEYLRTNGDPVGASVQCYKSIKKQLKDINIKIIGLGVTGSGRQIAGLHALTKGIINEIIAHATGASYFDKEVDTIFEIGGQDAKYTYLTNGVASDYAMNEACSAGTGSFLEESAQESLGINYLEIEPIALKAKNPPNFNDQCAAFISSDIKNASHENIKKEDIVAGLVYSICMNYANRVKGNRPMGKKIFMQGGVCYNKAVPVAMAALTGKKIIVPPEPGLIGAFGVALEIKKRIELGFLEKQSFDIQELINRKVIYHKPFKCFGNNDGCDRRCEISMIEVDGEKYPFGGACNKYYNLRFNIKADTEKNDLVALRQKLVFEKYASLKLEKEKSAKTIGINKSFIVNTYYPLYYNFFTKLGLKVILSENVDSEGTAKIGSSFCYPAEISHGLFKDLINKKPDYIFLPHIKELELKDEDFYKKLCVFVQSEPYYLRTTFKDEKIPRLLTPVISFAKGIENAEKSFIKLAEEIGFDKNKATDVFKFALEKQKEMFSEFKEIGKEVLERIKKQDKLAIVLFGRSYNAFAKEANLNIPHKFASRDRIVIPYDFLELDDERPPYQNMYWATGNAILRAAKIIKKNPLLFGCFITNFSCGPDSFIVSYFREIMDTKPSLTLELDSHSADAGINTRIEAAIDIMESYLELNKKGLIKENHEHFEPARIITKNKKFFVENNNEIIPLTDKRIKLVFPSMGELGTKLIAAVAKNSGIEAQALPVPTMETLKIGRAHTTCKECLPMILTTGSMIEYLYNRSAEEITVFLMVKTSGPCRQGQYYIYQENLIKKLKIKNLAILTSYDEKSFSEFGNRFLLRTWMGILISECMGDIKSVINVLAKDKSEAIKIFDNEFEKLVKSMELENINNLFKQIKSTAHELSKIELTKPLEEAKIISLVGEIYVRREEFSRLNLIETLEKKGFIVLPTPTSEYIYYCNYLAKSQDRLSTIGLNHKLRTYISEFLQLKIENKIKKEFHKSGLSHYNLIDIKKTVMHSKHLIPEDLLGETILTVGISLREIVDESCGIISIGPFGCMPSRVAESILNKEMNKEGKEKSSGKELGIEIDNLPFLAIETDGNAFPQIIQSKLEIFMLQADRLHEKIMQKKKR